MEEFYEYMGILSDEKIKSIYSTIKDSEIKESI